VSVLLIDGANPVYSAPKSWKVAEALAKVPFIVSFGSFIDETSVMADLILPDHSFLESWTESLPESGALTAAAIVAPAAMKPLFETRATPDVLFEVAGKLQKPMTLPWASFDEMIKASFDPLGEDVWSEAQRQGGWWGEIPQSAGAGRAGAGRAGAARASATAAQADTSVPPAAYVAPTFDGDAAQYPYQFLPYPSLQFHDGAHSHLPWLQELPDPTTSAMWSSWVELNPRTAASLNIALGDIVEVTSSAGTLRSPAFINPALAPELIAMPVGQGHTNFTRYASGRGQNPVEILAPVTEATTGALAWAATRVKVARVGDPDGKLILFSAGGELREKPHEGRTR
jgi:anaerobic selenocysteine-containing dehydrogenase